MGEEQKENPIQCILEHGHWEEWRIVGPPHNWFPAKFPCRWQKALHPWYLCLAAGSRGHHQPTTARAASTVSIVGAEWRAAGDCWLSQLSGDLRYLCS